MFDLLQNILIVIDSGKSSYDSCKDLILKFGDITDIVFKEIEAHKIDNIDPVFVDSKICQAKESQTSFWENYHEVKESQTSFDENCSEAKESQTSFLENNYTKDSQTSFNESISNSKTDSEYADKINLLEANIQKYLREMSDLHNSCELKEKQVSLAKEKVTIQEQIISSLKEELALKNKEPVNNIIEKTINQKYLDLKHTASQTYYLNSKFFSPIKDEMNDSANCEQCIRKDCIAETSRDLEEQFASNVLNEDVQFDDTDSIIKTKIETSVKFDFNIDQTQEQYFTSCEMNNILEELLNLKSDVLNIMKDCVESAYCGDVFEKKLEAQEQSPLELVKMEIKMLQDVIIQIESCVKNKSEASDSLKDVLANQVSEISSLQQQCSVTEISLKEKETQLEVVTEALSCLRENIIKRLSTHLPITYPEFNEVVGATSYICDINYLEKAIDILEKVVRGKESALAAMKECKEKQTNGTQTDEMYPDIIEICEKEKCAQEEIVSLKQKIKQLSRESEDLNHDLQLKSTKLDELKELYEKKLNDGIIEICEKEKCAQEEIVSLKQKIKELSQESDDLNRDLQLKSTKLDELKDYEKKLNEDIIEICEKEKCAQEEIVSLKQKMKELSRESEDLNQDLQLKSTELNELKEFYEKKLNDAMLLCETKEKNWKIKVKECIKNIEEKYEQEMNNQEKEFFSKIKELGEKYQQELKENEKNYKEEVSKLKTFHDENLSQLEEYYKSLLADPKNDSGNFESKLKLEEEIRQHKKREENIKLSYIKLKNKFTQYMADVKAQMKAKTEKSFTDKEIQTQFESFSNESRESNEVCKQCSSLQQQLTNLRDQIKIKNAINQLDGPESNKDLVNELSVKRAKVIYLQTDIGNMTREIAALKKELLSKSTLLKSCNCRMIPKNNVKPEKSETIQDACKEDKVILRFEKMKDVLELDIVQKAIENAKDEQRCAFERGMGPASDMKCLLLQRKLHKKDKEIQELKDMLVKKSSQNGPQNRPSVEKKAATENKVSEFKLPTEHRHPFKFNQEDEENCTPCKRLECPPVVEIEHHQKFRPKNILTQNNKPAQSEEPVKKIFQTIPATDEEKELQRQLRLLTGEPEVPECKQQ